MIIEDWISTQSVKQFNFLNPKVEDIHILDIAHSLSQLCRFGGHADRFYSVAEHSINVATLLEQQDANKITILAGLLHDATEAYLGDVPRPIKAKLQDYENIYLELSEFITFHKFKLNGNWNGYVDWEQIHHADRNMCVNEAKQLGLWNNQWAEPPDPTLHFPLHCWNSDDAKWLFIYNYIELQEATSG